MKYFLLFMLVLVSDRAFSSQSGTINLTSDWLGVVAILVFSLAYCLVIAEEFIHLKKSKPVLVAAGLIWLLLGWKYMYSGIAIEAADAFNHNLLEYSQLLLFLLVAMTYINALEERGLFVLLRYKLEGLGLSLRGLFWITGLLAFLISSFANNLTTAMLMCAIVMNVAKDNNKFICIACINIVVAANAGGAFSPFGDITTLMIWQAGWVSFSGFFVLFLPALVNYAVPALIMTFFIKNQTSHRALDTNFKTKRGAKRIVGLFILTIASAVVCQSILEMPPVLGMMFGLGYLKLFSYYLYLSLPRSLHKKRTAAELKKDEAELERLGNVSPFDIFDKIARAEWDTLMFFYGVVMCVGGLGFIGYLHLASNALYLNWEPLYANIAVGLLSAVVDNIPVVFAVLAMSPDMGTEQWLLVALMAGVGGSLLSIGSAAGVALMGQTKGIYSFVGHLKWSWAIALGFAASVMVHLWLNT